LATLSAVASHPYALVFAALAADTTVHVRGVGAVLEVVSAGCRQGVLQPLGPLGVGSGEPPHLIGSQAKSTQYLPERLATVDHVEELLSNLGR
jgi:hypothetical protein